MIVDGNSTKKANSTASNSTTDDASENLAMKNKGTKLSLAELEKVDLDSKKNATNSTDGSFDQIF